MNDKVVSDLYKIRFTQKELPAKNKIWSILCQYFFAHYINKEDTVVDVASGYGEFINNIEAAKKIAIDLNPDSTKFLNHDVAFSLSNAADLGLIVQGKADVVFTSNFLEHLPDKKALSEFLDQVIVALKPDGRYIILGPNLRYLPGKYWDFYDHHLGLTHLSLSEALKLHGFTIECCIDKFLPYTTQSSLPTHPLIVWLYLKIPFVWKFMGKQFFIVAKKQNN